MKHKWDKEKKDRLKELILSGHDTKEIAEIFSREFNAVFTIGQIENIKFRWGIPAYLCRNNQVKSHKIPHIEMGDYIICCDFHAPYYSERWTNILIDVARKEKINALIIVGDLLDMDFAKTHPVMEGQVPSTLDQEKKKVEPLFEALDCFDRIYLICGNHETRLGRKTNAIIQFNSIVDCFAPKLAKKIKFFVYTRCELGNDWLLVHPKSYSQVSGSVGIRLAEKFHRHIINAHGHFISLRYDRSGKHMGIDLGGMFDQNKIDYTQILTTTHPVWNNGFAMIKEKYITLFHEHSDMRKYIK